MCGTKGKGRCSQSHTCLPCVNWWMCIYCMSVKDRKSSTYPDCIPSLLNYPKSEKPLDYIGVNNWFLVLWLWQQQFSFPLSAYTRSQNENTGIVVDVSAVRNSILLNLNKYLIFDKHNAYKQKYFVLFVSFFIVTCSQCRTYPNWLSCCSQTYLSNWINTGGAAYRNADLFLLSILYACSSHLWWN